MLKVAPVKFDDEPFFSAEEIDAARQRVIDADSSLISRISRYASMTSANQVNFEGAKCVKTRLGVALEQVLLKRRAALLRAEALNATRLDKAEAFVFTYYANEALRAFQHFQRLLLMFRIAPNPHESSEPTVQSNNHHWTSKEFIE